MSVKTSAKPYSDYAVHPGEFLKDEIEFIGMTPRDLAERMDIPPHVIAEILSWDRSVIAEIAVELERALGIPACMWTRSQARYGRTPLHIAGWGNGSLAGEVA